MKLLFDRTNGQYFKFFKKQMEEGRFHSCSFSIIKKGVHKSHFIVERKVELIDIVLHNFLGL